MKLVLALLLIACVAVLVGCQPKKMRPLESQEETTPGGRPGEREVREQEGTTPGKPSKPVQPIEAEEEAGLEDIHFEYDKYYLTDEATQVMGENAEYLMTHAEVNVLIEGHCDERGTEEYNLALGEKRAIAARDFLVRFGIDRSRISIISYGEERPIDPAGTEEAWSRNRRAHFVLR